MNVLGRWIGVCYFQSIRDFVEDSTFQLDIFTCSETGRVRARATEICTIPPVFPEGEDESVQKNVFMLTGAWDSQKQQLVLRGGRDDKAGIIHRSVIELDWIEEEEKWEGTFRNIGRKEDTQRVELHRGCTRKDMELLEEKGEVFLEDHRQD